MGKQTTSFRLPEQSREKLKALADLFSESEAKVVERAVDYLYGQRAAVFREYADQKLKQIES